MKKRERRVFIEMSAKFNKVQIYTYTMQWYDNKIVLLESTYSGSKPRIKVKTFFKLEIH